jgi:hypothetical protein
MSWVYDKVPWLPLKSTAYRVKATRSEGFEFFEEKEGRKQRYREVEKGHKRCFLYYGISGW